MSFPQLGYPQYLSAAGPGAYGGERPGVLAAAAAAAAAASSGRPGAGDLGAGAGAAAVTSVLGMYAAAGPYAGAPNYSAFLPYAADLSLFSQMVSAPGSCAPFSPGRPLPSGPGPRGREAFGGGARGREAERRAGGTGRGGKRERPCPWVRGSGVLGTRRGRRAMPRHLGRADGRPGHEGGLGGSQEAAGAGPGRAAHAGGQGPARQLPRPGVEAARQAARLWRLSPLSQESPPTRLWAGRGRCGFSFFGRAHTVVTDFKVCLMLSKST